uniref:Uncharacterized protein n=1 Tax=Trypanosoma congolense (strain IL3000) TaxID=1068625 RepID=G0UW42_TRYCI|nr:conserved hypothetical protein [Trypanosoma congolense IL3000]
MPKTTVASAMSAFAAVAGNDNTVLYGVLSDMILEATDRPVKPNVILPRKDGLRTRQMAREFKELNSLTELFSLEEQLREVVSSQETRSRVRVQKSFLVSQYKTEERLLLVDEEKKCRNALWQAAVAEMEEDAAYRVVVGNEMYRRSCAFSAFLQERMSILVSFMLGNLEFAETSKRLQMRQLELTSRDEITKRRFVEVSRHIDMELLFQQSYRVSFWIQCTFQNFTRDIKLLDAEEERERCALERIALQKLAILANEQENEAARLVVIAVMRASLIRRKFVDDARLREVARLMLAVPIKETDIRGVIERYEMEKRHEIRVCFYLKWREIMKNALKPTDGASIVERLEWYERMCVFDQWRYGFNAIEECFDREARRILKWEDACCNLYQVASSTLTSLWREENEQYTNLKKLYHDFIWSTKVVADSWIVISEEESSRKRLVEAEVKESMSLVACYHLKLCELVAVDRAYIMMELEESCWMSLLSSNYKTLGTKRRELLLNEEENGRIRILAEARGAWLDIVLQEAAPPEPAEGKVLLDEGQRPMSSASSQIQKQFLADCWILGEQEQLRRDEIVLSENSGRLWEYVAIFAYVEEWNREEVVAEYKVGLCDVQLLELVALEELMRAHMEEGEKQWRKIFSRMFAFAFPQLCSCVVEELDDRLNIVAEAETAMSAMLFSRGERCYVKYCSEELWSACNMYYESPSESLQRLSEEFVHAVEPTGRKVVASCERSERLILMMLNEEGKCRLSIEKSADTAYESLQLLFDKSIHRGDEWRSHGVPSESQGDLTDSRALMEYFQRQEASFAAKRKANRERSRQILGDFFKKFYCARDAIVLEELVVREALLNFDQRPRLPGAVPNVAATRVSVRLFNLMLTTNGVVGPLFIAMHGTEENVQHTCNLCETQTLFAAGILFHISFPESLLEWRGSIRDESQVLYFTIGSCEGDATLATASFLLRADDLRHVNSSSVLSIPLDQRNGKINVVIHVT